MVGTPGSGNRPVGRAMAGDGLYAEQMPGDPWPWERADDDRKWTLAEMHETIVERTVRWGLLKREDQREYVRHMADHHYLRWRALLAVEAGVAETAGVNAVELLQKCDRQIIAAYSRLRDSGGTPDPKAEAKAIRDLFSGADGD